MINLILATTVLLTTVPAPDITYQMSTDEVFEHTTYSFHGKEIYKSPQHNIYILDNVACELQKNTVVYNENLVLKSRKIRKTFFSLEKDHLEDLCYLVVKNRPYDKMFNYNTEFDYWYPEYNTIIIKSSINTKTKKANYKRLRKKFDHKPQKILVFHMPKTKKIHHKK